MKASDLDINEYLVRERVAETERLRAENKRLLAASVALVQCRDALLNSLCPFLEGKDNYAEKINAIAAADAALK